MTRSPRRRPCWRCRASGRRSRRGSTAGTACRSATMPWVAAESREHGRLAGDQRVRDARAESGSTPECDDARCRAALLLLRGSDSCAEPVERSSGSGAPVHPRSCRASGCGRRPGVVASGLELLAVSASKSSMANGFSTTPTPISARCAASSFTVLAAAVQTTMGTFAVWRCMRSNWRNCQPSISPPIRKSRTIRSGLASTMRAYCRSMLA